MGACSFTKRISAESAEIGFDLLVKEADIKYGIESYNGSINTCCMGVCTLKLDKVNDTNKKKAYSHIKDKGNGSKFIASYVDLGVVSYRVITVKKRNVDYKAKFKLMFIVVNNCCKSVLRSKYKFDTKTEADKKAMEFTLETGDNHSVSKEYVNLLETGTLCTETYSNCKHYKTKPNLKPMPNRKIIEIHEYIFYGWASC